ncbi:response regulator [Halomonas marinisediminis]|uniref:Response regulator n=1 Tax=Halomonas marinisediminis TaxID=2546095 RepID=A0ABY2D3E2_9GAMM|nr:response regulator [Halomonas marinisediminis]TDA95767.1 response regulator [Halomonas marinisediminis]
MRNELRGARRPSPLIMVALLIQLALLVGGAGLLLYADGEASAWLMALLLGSSLNLMLLVLQPCRWPRGQRDPAPVEEPATPRNKPVVDAGASLAEARLRRQVRDLQDDLAQGKQKLSRLMAGRERAREASRLKSDYLSLMGRELQRLRQRLDELAGDPTSAPRTETTLVNELRERLVDLGELLKGLTGGEEASTRPPTRQGRVLIVDDGPVNLMLARQVLEREGLDVTAVTSGSEALALQKQEHFDLVLMDIFMEGMDGMETSRRWREQERAGHGGNGSVLVALTANVGDGDRRRFSEAGLDDFLAKPYRPQELVERVIRWLPERLVEPDA